MYPSHRAVTRPVLTIETLAKAADATIAREPEVDELLVPGAHRPMLQ